MIWSSRATVRRCLIILWFSPVPEAGKQSLDSPEFFLSILQVNRRNQKLQTHNANKWPLPNAFCVFLRLTLEIDETDNGRAQDCRGWQGIIALQLSRLADKRGTRGAVPGPWRTRCAALSTASSTVPRAAAPRFSTSSSSAGCPMAGYLMYFGSRSAQRLPADPGRVRDASRPMGKSNRGPTSRQRQPERKKMVLSERGLKNTTPR